MEPEPQDPQDPQPHKRFLLESQRANQGCLDNVVFTADAAQRLSILSIYPPNLI